MKKDVKRVGNEGDVNAFPVTADDLRSNCSSVQILSDSESDADPGLLFTSDDDQELFDPAKESYEKYYKENPESRNDEFLPGTVEEEEFGRYLPY